MFTVTNVGRSPRILHDRHGRPISFATGQMRTGIDLTDEHARKIDARGGAWRVAGSRGGDWGKRVQINEEFGTPTKTNKGETDTTSREVANLISQVDDMTWEEFREAARGFLGDKMPRGKAAILEALEALT